MTLFAASHACWLESFTGSESLLLTLFGEVVCLFLRMKVILVSRSGREIIKGGIELSDSVCLLSLYFILFMSISLLLSAKTSSCSLLV